MLIDFNKINSQLINRFKDGKGDIITKVYTDDTKRIMLSTILPGSEIGKHQHINNSEIIYCLEGTGIVICDDKTEIITPGVSHYCQKGSTHQVINQSNTNLIVFAVVANE